MFVVDQMSCEKGMETTRMNNCQCHRDSMSLDIFCYSSFSDSTLVVVHIVPVTIDPG